MSVTTTVKIPVKYVDTTKYKVTIFQEIDDLNGPDTWGNYTLETFGRGLITDVDPEQYQTETGKITPALQAKLRAGTAFFIDIYEHTNVRYSLSGEGQQDRWDTSRMAGLILFEKNYVKGLDFEKRREMARGSLEKYTQWANGEVYGYTIEDEAGNDIGNCGGWYGDNIQLGIAEAIPDALPENVTIIGEYPVSCGSNTYEPYFDFKDCLKYKREA